MTISRFEITNFRNIITACIQPSPHINIFYGLNGSGKTSILEAIHCLGLGRSFRTRHIKRTIHTNAEAFSLFASIEPDAHVSYPIGLERHKNGNSILRIAEKPGQSQLEIAKILPLQFINSESHRLLTGGPLLRRQYLDWGVFHSEPNFYVQWQRLYRALKQRNAAIKSGQSVEQVQLWDSELVICSEQLDDFRRRYLTELDLIFGNIMTEFLPNLPINLQYCRGWDDNLDLYSRLKSALPRDQQLGFTQYGAHRADLIVLHDNLPAHEVLSQGQQKLVAYGLRLSQGVLLNQASKKKCTYLIDDLPAELDHEKRRLVAKILAGIEGQVFVTGINSNDLSDLTQANGHKMFHVEQGRPMPIQPHE